MSGGEKGSTSLAMARSSAIKQRLVLARLGERSLVLTPGGATRCGDPLRHVLRRHPQRRSLGEYLAIALIRPVAVFTPCWSAPSVSV